MHPFASYFALTVSLLGLCYIIWVQRVRITEIETENSRLMDRLAYLNNMGDLRTPSSPLYSAPQHTDLMESPGSFFAMRKPPPPLPDPESEE